MTAFRILSAATLLALATSASATSFVVTTDAIVARLLDATAAPGNPLA